MADYASFSPSSGWGAGSWPAPGPRWRAAAAPLAALAVLLGLTVPASGSGTDPGRLAALAQRVAQMGPAIAGQAFAGVYVDGNTRRVHVELTSTDQASRLAHAVGGSGQVEIDQVGRSRKDLLALRDRIAGDRRALAAGGVQVVSVGPDYQRNRVVVGVASMTPQVVSALQRRYGAASLEVRPTRVSSFLDDVQGQQTQTGTAPAAAAPAGAAPAGAAQTGPAATSPLGPGVSGGMGIVQLIQDARGTAEIICTLGYVVEQANAAAQPAPNPVNPTGTGTGAAPQAQPQTQGPTAQPATNAPDPTQTNPAIAGSGAPAPTGTNTTAPLQTQAQASAGIVQGTQATPSQANPATNTPVGQAGASPGASSPLSPTQTNTANPTGTSPAGAAAPSAAAPAQTQGQVFGLTAGHCLQSNTAFFQLDASTGKPGAQVGTPVAKTDAAQGAVSSADAGLLMMNTTTTGASPTVATNQGQLQVVDATDPVQGQQACKYGVRTGFVCGVITQTDAMDMFSEGQNGPTITVQNLATFVNQQGQPLCNNGDSGGPVFMPSGQGQVVALGLVTGGPDNNLAECEFTTLAPTIQTLQSQGFSLGLLVASNAATPAQAPAAAGTAPVAAGTATDPNGQGQTTAPGALPVGQSVAPSPGTVPSQGQTTAPGGLPAGQGVAPSPGADPSVAGLPGAPLPNAPIAGAGVGATG